MTVHRRARPWVGYLATVGGVVLVSLAMWAVRAHLTSATIALLYLLAIYSSSLLWGMGPAVIGSILAVLALDYLYVPPVFTLWVAGPSEALSLIVFLAVTIATSRLASRASTQAREAQLRAKESRALFDLSEAIAGASNADAALGVIAEQAVHIFGVRSCAILLPDALGVLRVQASSPAEDPVRLTREEDGIAAYASGHHTLIPHESRLFVPVRVGTRRLGVLRIGPRPDAQPLPATERRLVETFAAAAAVAIDRRRLQEAATQAEILQKSDELKSALLSSVSHELRTPLATIKTGITALLQEGLRWDRAVQREVLSAANAEVDRLTRLIGNLLDLSRIEAGALQPDRQWYEIGDAVREAVCRIAGRLPDHTVTVEIPDGALSVFVDYVQIQQIVANLVDNAAKYSPPGTAIDVTAAAEDGHLVVRVRDHGPGIPAPDAERIFSKFYQIGRPSGGTGLGLAICRGLVEAHGGRIAVENPGEPGAVFAVTLPLGAPPAPSPAQL